MTDVIVNNWRVCEETHLEKMMSFIMSDHPIELEIDTDLTIRGSIYNHDKIPNGHVSDIASITKIERVCSQESQACFESCIGIDGWHEQIRACIDTLANKLTTTNNVHFKNVARKFDTFLNAYVRVTAPLGEVYLLEGIGIDCQYLLKLIECAERNQPMLSIVPATDCGLVG